MRVNDRGINFIGYSLRGSVLAQESQGPLTLEESIKIAMERSLTLHSATVGVVGSEFRRKEAITNFLPLWTGQYGYTQYGATRLLLVFWRGLCTGVSQCEISNVYNLNTTLNQPLFTGGLNLANYRSAKLGVDLSKETVETAKRDLVLQVRVGYFNILRTEKFLARCPAAS